MEVDVASSSARKSKELSVKRDLKELIFVDKKAFAANIDEFNSGTMQSEKK